MASSCWGVPKSMPPLAINGNVGIMTPGAAQFYFTDGKRADQKSIQVGCPRGEKLFAFFRKCDTFGH